MFKFLKRKIKEYKTKKIINVIQPGLEVLRNNLPQIDPCDLLPIDDNDAVIERYMSLRQSVPYDSERLALLSKRVISWEVQINGNIHGNFYSTYTKVKDLTKDVYRKFWNISRLSARTIHVSPIVEGRGSINFITEQGSVKCQIS